MISVEVPKRWEMQKVDVVGTLFHADIPEKDIVWIRPLIDGTQSGNIQLEFLVK